MLENLMDSILELTSRFVLPDWEALIALIPVGLLVVIVIWLILLVRKFATAGPTRRGRRRITPVPPPGIHMPGPSVAPFVAAIGAFLLFWGLVVGGMALWVGVIGLVVALLVWGAEGLRDYDHLADSHAPSLPEPVHAGPPPGVHMPGPSFRPFLAAAGVGVLFFGLVFGGWLLLVGILLTVWTLIGWLMDARHEYVKTVEADETGHLENIPEPRWPRRLMWVGGVLVALALLVDNGIVPPATDSAAGGEPGGSPPPADGEPQPTGPTTDVQVVAEAVVFTTTEVSVTGPDFTITFDNRDPQTPHDVDILAEDESTKLFDGDYFPGPEVRVYEVTGIEPGSYTFICSVHPNMTGTITVE
ncbi:MAG TPA: cytochrome c oxidase subunit 4 [Vitreimonas sp.]|nr:cytochrome c oxidase subunit 4 [Vitreimonas sp.]